MDKKSTRKRSTSKERKQPANSVRKENTNKYMNAIQERSRRRVEERKRDKEAKDKKKREDEHKRMREEQRQAELDILKQSHDEFISEAGEFLSPDVIEAIKNDTKILSPQEATAKLKAFREKYGKNNDTNNQSTLCDEIDNADHKIQDNKSEVSTLSSPLDDDILPVPVSPNDTIIISQDSVSPISTIATTTSTDSSKTQTIQNEVHHDEDSIPTNQTFERSLLMAYIENSKTFHDADPEDNDDGSVQSNISNESDTTVSHTNRTENPSTSSSTTHKRDVNSGLDGYTKTPSKHVIFCKAKITVPDSNTPTKKMREAIGTLLTTLLKIDTSVKLYEYMDKANKKFINNPTQIPETPSKIKSFFHGRYRPNSKSITIWPDVKVGFNIEPETFFEDVTALFQDTKTFGLFKKDLQAEETEEIGFLLFSSRQHDVQRLRKTIQTRTHDTYGFTPQLSLRWRKMVDPTKTFRGKKGTRKDIKNTKNDSPQALYIEVIKGTSTRILRSISRMYSKKLNKFPDNEKMRFIPSPTYIQNTYIHERYSELINRQNWYLMYSKTMTSFEIHSLDVKASQLPKTLRQYLMEMTNRHEKPLFLTVDIGWSGGIVFTFPAQYEDDARDRIADLGSYLHSIAGDIILLKHFTPGAAERALDAPWDPKLGRAVSKLQNELDEVILDCDEEEWMRKPHNDSTVIIDTSTDDEYVIKPGLFNHAPDDDQSLNTFGVHSIHDHTPAANVNSGKNIPQVLPDKRNITRDLELEELTVEGDASMVSIHSRLSVLEEHLKDVNRFGETFEMFINLLKQSGGPPGLANLLHGHGNTPDPREGEGDVP